jgi:two-component system chemotaxis response regulator CheB
VEALQIVAAKLPSDLPGSVFVVLHVPAWTPSRLPDILSRSGPLKACHPENGEPIEQGKIYVAPPDRHMILEKGHIHLSAGPKENRTRPAVNPLFRSAALAYGPRVVGVVLTGTLDDGTAGLWEIKRRGGIAIVQEPGGALYPDMPLSALENVQIDFSVGLSEMAPMLTTLAYQSVEPQERQLSHHMESPKPALTCPECRGPIEETRSGTIIELQCRVGHAYSTESYLSAHAETRERALWSAIVALEEGAQATREFAKNMPDGLRGRMQQEATETEEAATRIREVLTALTETNSTRLVAETDEIG